MRRYTRPVRRAIFFVVVLSLALTSPLVPGASPRTGGEKAGAQQAVTGHFTVRLRYKSGPWVTKLSLKLNKYQLIAFKICGVWNWPAARRFNCLGAGDRLPARTAARMEQSPIATTLKRDDSPGWGMVGFSNDPVIRVPLSNTATGDLYGKFYYRVTLRDLSGAVLVTSNKVQVTWHR
jgi:hypothetical protein